MELETVSVVENKIYAIGGAQAWPAGMTGAVEVFDNGLPELPQSVTPAGKLPTTWGEVKATQ